MLKQLSIIALLLLPMALWGQKQTFGGTILDQKTESELDGIEVQITNAETGAKYVAETNNDGYFEFVNTPVGKYELEVIDEDFNNKKIQFRSNSNAHSRP